MDRVAAARVLGVAADAAEPAVRLAYRRLIRAHHPDRAGAASTLDAARINQAYAVLCTPEVVSGSGPGRATPTAPPRSDPADPGWGTPPAPARPPMTPAAPAADQVTLVDDETVAFAFPADEVFPLLVDVANRVGDITYVDPEAGLLETIITPTGGPRCSVLITLQGRADRVEAFCTVEPLGPGAAPGAAAVVDLILHEVRTHLRPA